MKILLVMSPMFTHNNHYLTSTDNEMPIGLCYLAAALERSGAQVKILDGQLSKDTATDLENLIESEDFDVVGFSAVTPAASNTARLSLLVKQKKSKTTTIIGGVHPTVIGEGVLAQMPGIDIAVFGEGEQTIIELVDSLKANKQLDDVAGIAFRKAGGGIKRTAIRPLINDLDALPFPAYHLVDINKYTPPPGLFLKKPIIGMVSSRGCPYDCNFCADTIIWQGRCRMRKSVPVVDEMESLANKYGAKEIKFFDDTFTINRPRVVEICNEILKRKMNILWRCSSRVDRVDVELLQLMKKSGCCSISFGIESGSDEILKRMNKKTTIAQIKKAVKASKAAGIETKGFFMLNYPGDTIKTTEETIRLSRELNLDFCGFNLSIPYLGTQMREDIKKNFHVESTIWDNNDASYGDQIYFYQDALPVEYLKRAYKRAARGFYLRPKYIIRSIFRIRNIEMLKSYMLGLLRLLRIKTGM